MTRERGREQFGYISLEIWKNRLRHFLKGKNLERKRNQSGCYAPRRQSRRPEKKIVTAFFRDRRDVRLVVDSLPKAETINREDQKETSDSDPISNQN